MAVPGAHSAGSPRAARTQRRLWRFIVLRERRRTTVKNAEALKLLHSREPGQSLITVSNHTRCAPGAARRHASQVGWRRLTRQASSARCALSVKRRLPSARRFVALGPLLAGLKCSPRSSRPGARARPQPRRATHIVAMPRVRWRAGLCASQHNRRPVHPLRHSAMEFSLSGGSSRGAQPVSRHGRGQARGLPLVASVSVRVDVAAPPQFQPGSSPATRTWISTRR